MCQLKQTLGYRCKAKRRYSARDNRSFSDSQASDQDNK